MYMTFQLHFFGWLICLGREEMYTHREREREIKKKNNTHNNNNNNNNKNKRKTGFPIIILSSPNQNQTFRQWNILDPHHSTIFHSKVFHNLLKGIVEWIKGREETKKYMFCIFVCIYLIITHNWKWVWNVIWSQTLCQQEEEGNYQSFSYPPAGCLQQWPR